MIDNKNFLAAVGCLILVISGLDAVSANQNQSDPVSLQSAQSAFIENCGQWPDSIRYMCSVKGISVWFTNTSVYYVIPKAVPVQSGLLLGQLGKSTRPVNHTIQVRYVGANPSTRLSGEDAFYWTVNFINLQDTERSTQSVRAYAVLNYWDLFPGCNVRFYFSNGDLEYDLVASCPENIKLFKMEYIGIDSLAIDDNGVLRVFTMRGWWTESRPRAYTGSLKETIEGSDTKFVRRSDRSVGFELIAAGDLGRNSVNIDPRVDFATLLGGSGYDRPLGASIDSQGNVLVAGYSTSADSPFSTARRDLVFAQFSAQGQLNGITYFHFHDSAHFEWYSSTSNCTSDKDGNMYITSLTYWNSPGVPPFSNILVDDTLLRNPNYCTFKFSPSGSLIWSTLGIGGKIAPCGDGSLWCEGNVSQVPTNYSMTTYPGILFVQSYGRRFIG